MKRFCENCIYYSDCVIRKKGYKIDDRGACSHFLYHDNIDIIKIKKENKRLSGLVSELDKSSN